MDTKQLITQLQDLGAKAHSAHQGRVALQNASNQRLWDNCPNADDQAWRELSIRHMQLDEQLGQLEKGIEEAITALQSRSVRVSVQPVGWKVQMPRVVEF